MSAGDQTPFQALTALRQRLNQPRLVYGEKIHGEGVAIPEIMGPEELNDAAEKCQGQKVVVEMRSAATNNQYVLVMGIIGATVDQANVRHYFIEVSARWGNAELFGGYVWRTDDQRVQLTNAGGNGAWDIKRMMSATVVLSTVCRAHITDKEQLTVERDSAQAALRGSRARVDDLAQQLNNAADEVARLQRDNQRLQDQLAQMQQGGGGGGGGGAGPVVNYNGNGNGNGGGGGNGGNGASVVANDAWMHPRMYAEVLGGRDISAATLAVSVGLRELLSRAHVPQARAEAFMNLRATDVELLKLAMTEAAANPRGWAGSPFQVGATATVTRIMQHLGEVSPMFDTAKIRATAMITFSRRALRRSSA